MKTAAIITSISFLAVTANAAAPARCTASNGLYGTCIPTASCRGAGGTSDPGNFCPGGNDIQCCTWKECTNGQGIKGVCIPTEDCGGQTGRSDPGNHCPGPQNIQCCTWGGCANGQNQRGTCLPTRQCTGGSPDPGNHCPGPQDIQCCAAGGGTNPPSGGSSGQVSDNGLHFIEGFEGWNENFYRDSAGVLTIGYGHACQPDSACNSIHAPISRAEGDRLLRQDAQNAVNCVNSNVHTSLTQNQFDACVSFTFNLGCGNFRDIVGEINSRNFPEAERQWLLYTHAGGKELPGLVRRRREEVALFNS